MRQDNAMYNVLIKISFSSIGQDKSKLRKQIRKEGNALFNNALNTVYLRLYGIGHMVKNHS